MSKEENATFYAQLAAALLAQSKRDKEEILAKISALNDTESKKEDTEQWTRFLKFTDKEISKMPKQMRKEFRTNGLRAHIRKRVRGNSVNYEIRCRRNGYNISASGITVEEAKQRFIDRLHEAQNGGGQNIDTAPNTFDKFIRYYFENFRKRKVTELTYQTDWRRVKLHLLPYFGSTRLKDISPLMCQKLFDRLTEAGKGKTADELFSLLNCTFKYAIAHGIISLNPLATVFHVQHERTHGKALTKEEEKLLLDTYKGTEYELPFAVALYTGLRPNEYPTARIEGNFIIAKNSKRKTKKVEYKKIPISPMLRPFIRSAALTFPHYKAIWKAFTSVFPSHILYDLRTTFYTRCQECGVSEAARNEFVGHSLGALGNAYTDLSDEYLIKEGEKLRY